MADGGRGSRALAGVRVDGSGGERAGVLWSVHIICNATNGTKFCREQSTTVIDPIIYDHCMG